MKYVAGISVRQNSKRFPNKAMALVNGIPSFAYCYKNAKGIKGIDDVYVLTTAQSPDVIKYCDDKGINHLVSESETDVMGRYLKIYCEYVVRITGDDIFPCQKYFDMAVKENKEYMDYIYFSEGHIKGMEMEIIKYSTLLDIYRNLNKKEQDDNEYISFILRKNKKIRYKGIVIPGSTTSIEMNSEYDYRKKVIPYACYLDKLQKKTSPSTYKRYCEAKICM